MQPAWTASAAEAHRWPPLTAADSSPHTRVLLGHGQNLESNTTHRYGPNSFKLHRLPMPRPGQVLGLVGTNGIGKSTALKILAGGWAGGQAVGGRRTMAASLEGEVGTGGRQ